MPSLNQLTIAVCQMNPILGNFAANFELISNYVQQARANGADLIIFPELAVSGYWPEDLVLRSDFVDHEFETLDKIMNLAHGISIAIGHIFKIDELIFNAGSVFAEGKLIGRAFKRHLPNYDVFDEQRIFSSGSNNAPILVYNQIGDEFKIALMICEDAWIKGEAESLCRKGADFIAVINGSPFEAHKQAQRVYAMQEATKRSEKPLLYINRVGAQDELVFDGGSFALSQDGALVAEPSFFKSGITYYVYNGALKQLIISNELNANAIVSNEITKFNPLNIVSFSDTLTGHYDQLIYDSLFELFNVQQTYLSIVLATKEYIDKNSINNVYIGLSGGIDSALAAVIAVDALGKERVKGVLMPSRFSSEGSIYDSEQLAHNLQIETQTLSIETAFEALLTTLDFKEQFNVAEENLQARIRGVMLMALANKNNGAVLTTGNKSEYACGYATLYGDMCGAYAPLKDVYKTQVYRLANWRNEVLQQEVIPLNTILKEPSAELRHDQRDQDTLPPYDVLDRLLFAMIEQHSSDFELREYDPELLKKVRKLLKNSEFKRRQAALGPRVNKHSFCKGWRYPITNSYL